MPNPPAIDPGVLKNLYEFPDVCTTKLTVDIPQYPVSISLTNVGFETRNKESGTFNTRMGTTLTLHWEYITNGSISQILDFWNRHQGKLMTFILPPGHCIRTTIGLETGLWEIHSFWRFDSDNLVFDIDNDKNIINFSLRIKNVAR
jgi:hypothetical protein